MAKDLEVSLLLDYYGSMLTPKQQEVLSCYYDDDLSLSEIAENEGITRQGVRDAVKRGEAQLRDMEKHLGLLRKARQTQAGLDEIRHYAENLREYNSRFVYDKSITATLDKMLAVLGRMSEEA